jgi:hypothetical protein
VFPNSVISMFKSYSVDWMYLYIASSPCTSRTQKHSSVLTNLLNSHYSLALDIIPVSSLPPGKDDETWWIFVLSCLNKSEYS